MPRYIDAVHTADVAPVVHGYWRKDRKGHFYCSVCKGEALGKMEYENPRILLSVYCPHCGAKMNMEEEHGTVKLS